MFVARACGISIIAVKKAETMKISFRPTSSEKGARTKGATATEPR